MGPKLVIFEKIPDDKYSRKIFEILDVPRTISEISKICKIPKATVYRRIKLLSKLNFLETSGELMEGVRFYRYKRRSDYIFQEKPRSKKIIELIEENPGLCFTELMNQLGYASGTLSHCLSSLVNDEKLIRKRSGRRTWFFPLDTPSNQMQLIIHLRKETSRNILVYLLANPLTTFKQIRKFVGKSPPTVSLTLTHLIEIDLIKRIPGIYPQYDLTNKELTENVVKKIEPELLDTLKDRFADTFSYL